MVLCIAFVVFLSFSDHVPCYSLRTEYRPTTRTSIACWIGLVLLNYAIWLAKKNTCHFLNQWKPKTKPIVTQLSQAFSRANGAGDIRLLLFCGIVHCTVYVYCDWPEYTLIAWFQVTTRNWKLLYCSTLD